jgi:hypothetical protein
MIARFVAMLERGETFHEPRTGARARSTSRSRDRSSI